MTIAMVEIHDWWLRMTIAMVQNTIDDWEHDRYSRKKKLMIENVDPYGREYRLSIGDGERRPIA